MHQLSVSASRIWSDSICGGFNVTQDVTQGKDLDQWIEHQITANPKITTDELAKLSGKTLIEQGRVRSTGIKAATKYACKKGAGGKPCV